MNHFILKKTTLTHKIIVSAFLFIYIIFLEKTIFESLDNNNNNYIKRKTIFYFYKILIAVFLSGYFFFSDENKLKNILNRRRIIKSITG